MEQLLETFISQMNITMHEDSPIEKLDYSIYNGQSLVSTWGLVCVGNGIFFLFQQVWSNRYKRFSGGKDTLF